LTGFGRTPTCTGGMGRDVTISEVNQFQIVDDFSSFVNEPSVQKLSFLSESLKTYKTVFRERFSVFFFDDLVNDPIAFRNEISKFLDISADQYGVSADRKSHSALFKKDGVPLEILPYASKVFKEEYENLATILGSHALDWNHRNRVRLDRIGNAC
jgi:hypothetical protein